MYTFRFAALLLPLVSLLSAPAALAQQQIATPKAPAVKSTAQPAKTAAAHSPVVQESLSGLDLIPNRRTGTFGIRINHRLTQPATLRLINTQTSQFVKTELLEPSPAPSRAVQVGRLASGEYKMEVVMTDTTYWKTVRVSR